MKKYIIELNKEQVQFIITAVKSSLIKNIDNIADYLDIVEIELSVQTLECLYQYKEKKDENI